jgi:anti-sigma regulatory factor (Ser/Thr protein kinase)
MALIHEQLYRSDDLSQIDFAVYVEQLAAQLRRSHDGGVRLAVRVEAEHCRLPLDQAVPCGMIVSELVSNAAQNTLSPAQEGRVVVSASRRGQQYRLRVQDNGIGVPPETGRAGRIAGAAGRMRALVRQIHGQLHMECQRRYAQFEIAFPASGRNRVRAVAGERRQLAWTEPAMPEPSSILIVEDEEIVALDIACQLERLGYRVRGRPGPGKTPAGKRPSRNPIWCSWTSSIEGDLDGVEAAGGSGRTPASP